MEIQNRIITFDKKGLYGPKLTNKIRKEDFFYDCYKKAVKETKEIVKNNDTMQNPRNIIAFLGNRGQGKTSMMISYVEALKNMKKNEELFEDELIDYKFIALNRIDPSTFEDCSNVLDVVLGQLLDRIQDSDNHEERNELLHILNKLYTQINLIKDKSLLIGNFELYEGAIESLSTINDITKFKKNLSELVIRYLDMEKTDRKTILVIPIDDIDLSLTHCYETVETLRKYLNIPRVLVVMAAKLEQLHEGIRLENLNRLKGIHKLDSDQVYDDIYNMSTKYLSKLLPQNRRIHIPYIANNIDSLKYDIRINTETEAEHTENKEGKPLEMLISEELYKKTGIIIFSNNQVYDYLLNGNLRDIIDLYTCLRDMEMPDYSEYDHDATQYLKNLEKFKDYFLYNWCENNLTYKSARLIRNLYNRGSYYKNHSLLQLIHNLGTDKSPTKEMLKDLLKLRGKKELFYDLSDVSYYLNKIENHIYAINIEDTDRFVYAIKMCYSIIMNQLRFVDMRKNKQIEYIMKFSKKNDKNETDDKSIERSSYLEKFIGGRILKENILHKVIKDGKPIKGEESRISNKINEKINDKLQEMGNDTVPVVLTNDEKKCINLLLCGTLTAYDKYRDIYFYNLKGRRKNIYYYDPSLFFLNCIDLYFTQEQKVLISSLTSLTERIDSEKFLENYSDIIKKLELISKTVICNFQIYDFYIDYLDRHYTLIDTDNINVGKMFNITASWLNELKRTLNNQNKNYFSMNNSDQTQLFAAIEVVEGELKKLSGLFENDSRYMINTYTRRRIKNKNED